MLRSLWISTRLAILPTLVGTWLIYQYLPNWSWNNHLFHAFIEGGGALIGFALALIVIAMIHKKRLSYNYTWLVACFLSMGILDIAHSLKHAGEIFVWLHSCATFIGGLFAALIWLPTRFSKQFFDVKALWLLLLASISFSLWSFLSPEAMARMLDQEQNFTLAAKFLNISGGIGFLIAWGYFARAYHYKHHPESFYFSNHFCLFALAGFLFEASILWDGNWWLWHMLRAFAYVLLMFHFGGIYWRDISRIEQINRSLKHEIDERIRLTSSVFENTSEAIVITDARVKIIDCNQAYTDISGYTLDEVRGQDPKITQSGRHDKAFYQQMWDSINSKGNWTGEIWDRRKNGEVYPKLLSINTVQDDLGKLTHYIGVFSDISHLKETERKLQELAFTDSLTGLPNRQLLHNRLEYDMSIAHRNRTSVALIFIDLDQFKRVNDTLGHQIGDELLYEIGQRLKLCVRETDMVARLGGDEFTIILTNLSSYKAISDIANKIIESINKPIKISDNELFVGASIGISIYPDDSQDKATLLRNADSAMYHAKENGRGYIQFFNEDINQRNQQRNALENNLKRAIQNQEFELYFQPQVNTMTHEVIGCEALIRWNDPDNGVISPQDFIPVAEENGTILAIGQWIFEEVCQHLRYCNNNNISIVRTAINLSAVQFRDENLVEIIVSALKNAEIPTDWIELEITESAIMENPEETAAILEQLRATGIRISIDDFGTGYSSLAYLKRYPFDKLKIDREFIDGLPDNNNDVILTRTIINLANSLDIDVLAEGVENIEQVNLLDAKGCHIVQGFYYSRPLPADEFIDFIASRNTSSIAVN